jgi:hypothetical protein
LITRFYPNPWLAEIQEGQWSAPPKTPL